MKVQAWLLVAVSAASGADALARLARLGVKGGQYDVDGFNALGYDALGFNKDGLDKWNRTMLDTQGGLVPPQGNRIDHNRTAPTTTTRHHQARPSGRAWQRDRDDCHKKKHRKHHRHHRPTRTHSRDPTPFITPIPFTTINGTVVPHPTYIFPLPTATDVCYNGFVTFEVQGNLDRFGVEIYLAKAARLIGIPYEELTANGYDATYNAAQNATDITVLFCDQAVFDLVVEAVLDSRLADGWRRIGTMEVVIIKPTGEIIREVFMCPIGYYLFFNTCLPCQGTVANCSQIFCTNAADATCAAGGCNLGFYNALPGLPSDCLACYPVAFCLANATVCTQQYNGVCLPGQCEPGYVNTPQGACIPATP